MALDRDACPRFVATDSSSELVEQLGRVAPSGTGFIPAMKTNEPHDRLLPKLLARKFETPSPARAEIQRRIARSPLEIARQLSEVYGHQLPEVVYIPAVALIGRLRLGHLADVEEHCGCHTIPEQNLRSTSRPAVICPAIWSSVSWPAAPVNQDIWIWPALPRIWASIKMASPSRQCRFTAK